MEYDDLITPEHAAFSRGTGAHEIYQLIKLGVLPSVTVDGQVFVSVKDLEDYEKEQPGPRHTPK
jgi:hypothetical protein